MLNANRSGITRDNYLQSCKALHKCPQMSSEPESQKLCRELVLKVFLESESSGTGNVTVFEVCKQLQLPRVTGIF